MAYALLADVEAEFPGTVFEAGKPVTDTMVESWLDMASAMIDGYISKEYVVPVVSGDGALLQLKDLCLRIVEARIRPKLAIGNAEKRDIQDKLSEKILAGAIAELEKIKLGELTLVDAPRGGGSPVFNSYEYEEGKEIPITLETDW